MPTQIVAFEPCSSGTLEPVRPAGQEHDLVILGESSDDRHPLVVHRIVVGGIEECVPVARPPLEVVESMPDVGDDAVDVDDRQWRGSGVTFGRHRYNGHSSVG